MGKKEGKDTLALVYIKDPEYAWIPATMNKEEGGKAYVTVPQYKDEQSITSDGGRAAKSTVEQVVNLKDYPHKVLPLQNVDKNGNLLEFADMVQLPYLHEVRFVLERDFGSLFATCLPARSTRRFLVDAAHAAR